ncbi:hypothetical protein ACJX0J_014165, partial [Zea mays]
MGTSWTQVTFLRIYIIIWKQSKYIFVRTTFTYLATSRRIRLIFEKFYMDRNEIWDQLLCFYINKAVKIEKSGKRLDLDHFVLNILYDNIMNDKVIFFKAHTILSPFLFIYRWIVSILKREVERLKLLMRTFPSIPDCQSIEIADVAFHAVWSHNLRGNISLFQHRASTVILG